MRVDPANALLQVLLSGPGFGLELIKRVEQITDGKMVLHQGNAYPALRKLERDGLVESYKGETVQDRAGRPRIYYRLTGLGRRVALEAREAGQLLFGSALPALG